MPTVKLTAAQLSAVLSTLNSNSFVEAEVDEEVLLNSANSACNFAILANITFNRRVRFDNPSIATGIEFVNCVFNDDLSFENYSANNHIVNRIGFHSISLNSCKLNGQLVVLGCRIERGIQLIDCEVQKRLLVESLISTNGFFTIERSTIAKMDLHDLKLTGLTFEQSKIQGWARLSHVVSQGSFVFKQTTFEKSFYVWAGETTGITSNDSIYCEPVRFQAVKNHGTLTLYGDNFHKTVQIDNHDQNNGIVAHHGQIYLSNTTFGAAFIFNGDNEEIETLTIVCSISLTGTITIGNCKIRSASIKNDNHKGSLFFNSVFFEKLNFLQFNNYANLALDSCAGIPGKNCEFVADRSNLGRAQFQNFDFIDFRNVKIAHSLLSNIEFSGVNWFNRGVLDVGPNPNRRARIRDLYRQLKQASEKQGDKIQALEFQEQEMEELDIQLGEMGERWTSRGLSLLLARTNDYGRHWIKPTCLLLLSLIFFWISLALSASNRVQFAPACNREDIATTWDVLIKQISVVPQLLNPTRNLAYMFPNEKLGFWTYFWDAAQRILLTFLLVQIVSSFRKHYRN